MTPFHNINVRVTPGPQAWEECREPEPLTGAGLYGPAILSINLPGRADLVQGRSYDHEMHLQRFEVFEVEHYPVRPTASVEVWPVPDGWSMIVEVTGPREVSIALLPENKFSL